MKPPRKNVNAASGSTVTTASITNSSSVETTVDGSEAIGTRWGADLPSTYEILRREGEIHEGRATVLDELQRNFARLEDLHGQLHFVLNEVESVLRR